MIKNVFFWIFKIFVKTEPIHSPYLDAILDKNVKRMRVQILKLDFVKKCKIKRIKGKRIDNELWEANKLFIQIKVNEAHYVAELLTGFDFKDYIKNSCRVSTAFEFYKWDIKIDY